MKRKIIIPESIADITLGQYQKLMAIDNELDDYTKVCKKLEIFTGLIRSEIDHITQKDLSEISNQIDLALNIDGEFKTRFTMNGIEFGLIPNFDKIQTKEYVDLSSYGIEIDTLHNVMAILYRPIKESYGKTYSIQNYKGTEDYADAMKNMPLSYVNGALAFFLTLQNDLLKAIQKYTSRAQARADLQMPILESGVGTQVFMN